MRKSLFWAAGALVAGMTFAGAASAGSLPAPGTSVDLTQQLSARCRTVVDHRWRNGRRVTVRRTVCDRRSWRPHCRTVVTHKWRHGHRVIVRKRVC
jgi:hypothetical protein